VVELVFFAAMCAPPGGVSAGLYRITPALQPLAKSPATATGPLTVISGSPSTPSLRSVSHGRGERLTGDQCLVVGDCLEPVVAGPNRQRDPVRDVEAGIASRLLHEPHQVTGAALDLEFRSDLDVEGDHTGVALRPALALSSSATSSSVYSPSWSSTPPTVTRRRRPASHRPCAP
jgi:hypothetical protein